MWASTANDPDHSGLSTAKPKWVPYTLTNNSHLSDIPLEGTSSDSVLKNPKLSSFNVPHNDIGANQPVIRRVASAPLQYQEVIPRGSSTHSHSTKSFSKKRPNTEPPKNKIGPRIKASVSTISWREELIHFKSSHPQSPQKSRSLSKASIPKSEENFKSKNPDDSKISKKQASKTLRSVDFNGGNVHDALTEATLSSLKTSGSNGQVGSPDLGPHSKMELKHQNQDAHLSNLLKSISAVTKFGHVSRSHMDMTDQKESEDSVLHAKKRCSSENNLMTDKKHTFSGVRSSSLSGKTRREGRTHTSRKSPIKVDKKPVIEVPEALKEKKKSYDPEKAREYIKQQRCERLSSIREEKERKKASEEAKKQKLFELDQKRHFLLQANIKKKPYQVGEEKNVQLNTEDLKAPSSVLVPKLNSVSSNISLHRPATTSTVESGLYVFPGPPHPVAPSGDAKPSAHHASSDIIKDNDIKATIIFANSIKKARHSNKHSARDKKKPPTVVDLQDSVELKIGEKDVKIQPKPLSLGKPLLIKKSFDAAEVDHLTSNLRKMKENFRSVLAQNLNIRARPKSETKLRSSESGRSIPSLAERERLQQWLQKIPSGGLSGSSTEIDKAGSSGFHKRPKRRRTKSNILNNSYQRTRSSTRRHETSDDSDQENLSGDSDQENVSRGPLHHLESSPKSESDTGVIPEWLKPLTQEPYPVNFMSVVKRKMAAKNAEKGAPLSTLAFSTEAANPPQTQPTASHTLYSSNNPISLFVPPISQDPIFGNQDQSMRHPLIPPSDELFSTPTSHHYSPFPVKPNLVEKSQQTTPKDSATISPIDDLNDSESKPATLDTSSWSGQIINTSVPPLPRLSSTTTEVSSRIVSPELVSSGTSTRVSKVSVKPGFVEDEKEPPYESDSEEAQGKSVEDTDAPSISSTIPENYPDSESIRLVTPNVDLFSQKSEWSSRRDCGDGEHASQESSNQTGKESFEIGRLFNPEALHLQFQAELNRFDAFSESLFHMMEVEKVRAVTLAREQALLSSKPLTPEQPSSKSDKAVSVQKSLPASSVEVPTINYSRGSCTNSIGEGSKGSISIGEGSKGSISIGEGSKGSISIGEGSKGSISIGEGSKGSISIGEGSKGTILSDEVYKGTNSSGEVSTVNYARGSGDVEAMSVPEEVVKTLSSGDTIKTDIQMSTESHSSPVSTSSIPEKSPSLQSSDATIPEEIKSLKSLQEAVRKSPQLAKEKGPQKRLKSRQASDKVSSESLSRGSKAASIEDESSESLVFSHGPDSARSGDGGAVSKTERSERRSGIPTNNEDAFKFTLQMLEQLMYEEELRVQHKKTLLKLRERVLCDMAKAECASLDLDKKKLRDMGAQEEQISALRKKQRGVLMKFQQQRDEINLMQRTDELVWKERRLMYLRQLHLFRMQMSTRSHKNRREEDSAVTKLSSRGIASRRDHELDITPDFNALLASASLSSPAASDLSIPSAPHPANTSGDTESSCIDERPLQSIMDFDLRPRNSRDLDPLRQPVEQLNLWGRRLEEERQLRDAERPGHSRYRPVHLKHSLRDRSTSPFHFSEIASNFGRNSGNVKQRSRSLSNGSVDDDSSVTEDIADQHDSNMSSIKEALSAAAASEGYTESFESIESDAKTAEVQTQSNGSKETSVKKVASTASESSNGVKTKQLLLHEKSEGQGQPSVTIKIPLSPRLQRLQRRRCSSGSDDSIVFSQTETGSEQSDIEGRITALTEQLELRKAEAERLRREAKRTRSERLQAKEQSLQKQLQAYDVYISQARQNLEAELKQTSVPIVRPQIKQPRVASSGKAKTANTAQQAEQDASTQDSVAESSASQDSSLNAVTLSPSKQNDAELDFVLPETSGPKDVISDAMSSVASGDISEVSSESGSTISNENASLVANTGIKMAVKKAVLDSDTLSNAGSDVASEMEISTSTEIIEDVYKQDDAVKEDIGDCTKRADESNQASTAPSPVSSDHVPLEKADTSDSEDTDDFIEEADDEDVIKVVLKEKEKGEDEKLEVSPEPDEFIQPCIVDKHLTVVDKITDSILEKLLSDCIQATKTHVKSREIIEREDRLQDSGEEQTENKAKDVRSRVSKILADTIHSPSSRTEPRIQDLMVTTYDILSPDDSPCVSPHQSSPTRQTSDHSEYSNSRDLTQGKSVEGSGDKLSFEYYGSSSDPASIFHDSIQDWLEEECSGVAEKEGELLRLQEMKILQRIQQLDQAIDQIPFLIREIPNKPPPPYTPPGQAPRVLATSVPFSPPLDEIRAVPKIPSESSVIIRAVTTATDMLYEAHSRNQDLKTVIPSESFLIEGYIVPEHVKLSDQDLQIHRNSARVYRQFLFDLARQLVEEAYSHENEEVCPPWLQPENVFSKRKTLAEAPKSRQQLQQVVSRQVLALLGLGPKAEKENLTIRWSRKKRDQVDELLVRELQEEERQWTSYEYDEAFVKNNVTESILEALLSDTTEVVKEIFQRRQRGLLEDSHAKSGEIAMF